MSCIMTFFFFSSRRRHTRSDRDWSSDVCSSDLNQRRLGAGRAPVGRGAGETARADRIVARLFDQAIAGFAQRRQRGALAVLAPAGKTSELRRGEGQPVGRRRFRGAGGEEERRNRRADSYLSRRKGGSHARSS